MKDARLLPDRVGATGALQPRRAVDGRIRNWAEEKQEKEEEEAGWRTDQRAGGCSARKDSFAAGGFGSR